MCIRDREKQSLMPSHFDCPLHDVFPGESVGLIGCDKSIRAQNNIVDQSLPWAMEGFWGRADTQSGTVVIAPGKAPLSGTLGIEISVRIFNREAIQPVSGFVENNFTNRLFMG